MPLPPPPNKKAAKVAAVADSIAAVATSQTSEVQDLTVNLAKTTKKTAKPLKNASGKKLSQALEVETKIVPETVQATPKNKKITSQASLSKLENADTAAAEVKTTRTKKTSSAQSSNPLVKRLFVLDTNVLMHDPMCLFQFHEHDIFLPMVVLEELDNHKKGMTEVARNARQTSRSLDGLVANTGSEIEQGLLLNSTGHKGARGKLFFQTTLLSSDLPSALPQGKADNQILAVVNALRISHAPQEVVLVSKDINMRVKARALGLKAEDYQNDKALDDGDLLYTGSLALPDNFWQTTGNSTESWQEGIHTYYRFSSSIVDQMHINQFVYLEQEGETALYARVTEIRGQTAVVKSLKDFRNPKYSVWGVNARNREQNFAMNLLLDPEIDFVSLTGTAGTGKTLLALACGLTQVLDDRRYSEIIMTRATVSVGEDIGFLPGTEEEKMGPWMGAMDDNLEVLTKFESNAGEWGKSATHDLLRSRIKIKSMNFMRGRTFLSKFVIIDEAQNLTPKQMKTLITRAGPGTKIICMGNLAQIDTPYLTEGSSGLTFAVDKFKGWPHGGHITLARGERSRLADFASDVL